MSQSLGRDRARPFTGDQYEDPKFRDLAEDSPGSFNFATLRSG